MERVVEKLDSINKTLEKILGVVGKQEHPFIKGLTVAGAGVGVLGILQIIDTIRGWF